VFFQEPKIKSAAEADILGRFQLQLDSHASLLKTHANRMQRIEDRQDLTESRAAEDRDEQLNRSYESRVVFHGLPCLVGLSRPELRDAAFKRLTDVLKELFPTSTYTLISASYFDSERPVYEGSFSSVSEAAALRRDFGKRPAAARKATGYRLLNSVTPGTRVRLSILRTLSAAYKRKHPSGIANVLGFLPRPVIKYRPEGSGPFRTSGFVDAVTTLTPISLGLIDADFQHAYRTAGQKFAGQLSSLFLVLSDRSPQAIPAGQSRKRANDGTPVGASSSRRANLDAEAVNDLEVRVPAHFRPLYNLKPSREILWQFPVCIQC